MATITITVTVAGGKFLLDGVSQATYSATPGNTYKFDQADASNGAGGGHPLRLATAADAAGSTEYTTGVTTNGSPGSAGAYTQIVVTATTTQALHYYCSNHTGMGGLFNVGGTGTVQYQEREGFAVQNKSSDPATGIAGDMYYNTMSGQFKAINAGGAPIGSWSSGGTMNTARAAMNSFGASKDSAIVGNGFPGPTGNVVEQYNGTSWTEIAEYNTSRAGSPFGGGTVAAGIVAGGQPMPPATGVVANTESWNGSAWSEVNDLPNARTYNFGTGTSTAALSVGNYGPGPQPGSPGTEVASWDGTNWTEVAETNDKRRAGQGQGSAGSPYTDFIASGGEIPPGYVGCETWNGTSWTEVANNNQQRYGGFGSGASSTSAIIYGGGAPGPGGGPRNAETEVWDGTSWTEIGDMATARVNIGGSNSGSGGNALAAGGETTTAYTGISEEWSAADFQIKTVTTS